MTDTVPTAFRLMRRTVQFWVGGGLMVGAVILGGIALILAEVGAGPVEEPGYHAITARVVDLGSTAGGEPWVSYRFETHQGREIVAERRLPEREWQRLRRGGPVPVVYREEEPSDTHIAERAPEPAAIIIGAIAALEGAIGAWLFGSAVHSARRLVRIGRDGVRISARVDSVARTSLAINNVRQYRLGYRYLDEAGTERTGQSRMGPHERFGGLKPGDAVEIAVDPEDTRRSIWLGDLEP